MSIGWPQILLIVLLVILLFGRGRISTLMGDVANGIKSFRSGLREDIDDNAQDSTLDTPPIIEQVDKPAPKSTKKTSKKN